MKVVKVLIMSIIKNNIERIIENNIENPIIPIRSMISNAKKAEKYLPLNYGYKGVVKTNVFCYNPLPNE